MNWSYLLYYLRDDLCVFESQLFWESHSSECFLYYIEHRPVVWGGVDYTERRLLPFDLRRATTFRPDLVCIRERKPCLRLRFSFFGLNRVIFIKSFLRVPSPRYKKQSTMFGEPSQYLPALFHLL
jgi:hypothetical protein